MILRHLQHNEAGFSLIELLMAMSVFSFMLLIISVGFIGIVHINQSTTASRNTQQNARIVIETIERELRAASTVAILPGSDSSPGRLCLYTGGNYIIYMVSGNDLVSSPLTSLLACDSAVPVAPIRKLNDGAVQVARFVLSTTAAPGKDGGLVTVDLSMVGVGINIATELDSNHTACKPIKGSQFCSVTTLTTTAELRGGADR